MIMVRHNTIYKNKYFFCCYRVFAKSFSFFFCYCCCFRSVVVANSLTAHAGDIASSDARSDAHSAYQLRGDHQPSPSTRWFRVESCRAVPNPNPKPKSRAQLLLRATASASARNFAQPNAKPPTSARSRSQRWHSQLHSVCHRRRRRRRRCFSSF